MRPMTTAEAAAKWAEAKDNLEAAEASLKAAQEAHAEARNEEGLAWEELEQRARRWPPDSGPNKTLKRGDGPSLDDLRRMYPQNAFTERSSERI
jgi:hypothetical protein